MGTTERWEPPFHAAVPRLGTPGVEYSSTDARGVRHTIRADANGIVWPVSPEDVRLADATGLAVASDWTNPALEAVATEPTGLSDLTVAQLRERADALGLDVPPRARKADLLDAIAAAETTPEAPEVAESDETETEDDEPDEDFPTD